MSRSTRQLVTTLAIAAAGVVGVYAQQAAAPARFQPDAKSAEITQQHAEVLSKMSPVTDAMLRSPAPGDWLQWRRTYDEHGFSPLTQINKNNVANLRSVWTWTLPPGTSEIAPLVHDGVMFVYGRGDRIQALDAVSGDLLWEYVYPEPTGPRWPGAAGTYRKNFAIYGDKLFFPTGDSHEIALEMTTGKVAWDHQMTDIKVPYRASSGALPVNGKVIQGTTNCSRLQAGGCVIIAMDAATGNEAWRFHTIPQAGEAGEETWNGAPLEKRQGASVWTTPSYDPELNLAYVGTGNTYDWQDLIQGDATRSRTKDGLYADTTLAINPDTGKLVWHYQHLPQDIWDLDFAFDRHIVTLNYKGRPQKLVVTTGKTMITDGLDAATGKWVFSKDEGLQTIVKSIDPVTGEKTYNERALFDMSGYRTTLQCPMNNGGKDWPSNGYDPGTKMMYLTIAEACAEVVPRKFGPDNPYTGGGQETGALRYLQGSDGNIGRLVAINLETQKTVWTIRQRATLTSAALVTAGGLLFVGDSDRWFRAYDAATGKVLWQTRLNDAINSFPISYSVNGKQYIAIAAGMGGPQIASYHSLTPEIQLPRGGGGAAMWVFELPASSAR